MGLNISVANPVVSVIFGLLILVFPRALNYLIAFYLIINGLIGLGAINFS
ncbi:DUF3096 domain-containing protein [Candidatus Roizmanbacteria bacterium]|nr:DUF3096 domain-containing protein [Candidatus Roizmanbacteria bacterium]